MKRNMTLDYTWERREVLIREEEREEGRAEGRAEGRTNTLIGLIKAKQKKGKTIVEIADDLEITEAEVESLMASQ